MAKYLKMVIVYSVFLRYLCTRNTLNIHYYKTTAYEETFISIIRADAHAYSMGRW